MNGTSLQVQVGMRVTSRRPRVRVILGAANTEHGASRMGDPGTTSRLPNTSSPIHRLKLCAYGSHPSMLSVHDMHDLCALAYTIISHHPAGPLGCRFTHHLATLSLAAPIVPGEKTLGFEGHAEQHGYPRGDHVVLWRRTVRIRREASVGGAKRG